MCTIVMMTDISETVLTSFLFDVFSYWSVRTQSFCVSWFLPLGVVDGRLLQRQARVGIQNHGRFRKGTELCAAPVAPRLGWNRPCGLQWVPVLQQAPEQHPGRS